MARERTPEELAEDIDEIQRSLTAIKSEVRAGLAGIAVKLDALPFVRVDVYEARHTALRDQIALELASIRAEVEAAGSKAEAATRIGMWALGILASILIAGLVTFIRGTSA